MNFTNNVTNVNNIKRGEILVNMINTNTYQLIPKNLPIPSALSNINVDATGGKKTINLKKNINILSVSFWGKDYSTSTCPAPAFRYISDGGNAGITVSHENNVGINIIFPKSPTLTSIDNALGIISTNKNNCFNNPLNSNKSLIVAKIIILYSDENTIINQTPATEYYNNSMIGI